LISTYLLARRPYPVSGSAANPFDLWVNVWRKKWAQGEVVVIRYADDSAPRRRGEENVM